ncbi:MAG: tetratricopeptide repeat protein [Candidatus Muiribacteriaceae bacterium]
MKKIIILISGILISAFLFTGCTNGGGGVIGSMESEENFQEQLQSAWATIHSGDYKKAVIRFNEVKRQSKRASDKDEAWLGMGWAYLKDGDFGKAQEAFDNVSTGSQELNIGRANLYIICPKESLEKDDFITGFIDENKWPDWEVDPYEVALSAMRSADLYYPDTQYVESYPLKITQIYCNALAAIILYLNGFDHQATDHINHIGDNPDLEFEPAIQRIYEAMLYDLSIQ